MSDSGTDGRNDLIARRIAEYMCGHASLTSEHLCSCGQDIADALSYKDAAHAKESEELKRIKLIMLHCSGEEDFDTALRRYADLEIMRNTGKLKKELAEKDAEAKKWKGYVEKWSIQLTEERLGYSKGYAAASRRFTKEIEGLKEALKDWENSQNSILSESCDSYSVDGKDDRVHCTCVPDLKRSLAHLRKENAELKSGGTTLAMSAADKSIAILQNTLNRERAEAAGLRKENEELRNGNR